MNFLAKLHTKCRTVLCTRYFSHSAHLSCQISHADFAPKMCVPVQRPDFASKRRKVAGNIRAVIPQGLVGWGHITNLSTLGQVPKSAERQATKPLNARTHNPNRSNTKSVVQDRSAQLMPITCIRDLAQLDADVISQYLHGIHARHDLLCKRNFRNTKSPIATRSDSLMRI